MQNGFVTLIVGNEVPSEIITLSSTKTNKATHNSTQLLSITTNNSIKSTTCNVTFCNKSVSMIATKLLFYDCNQTSFVM